MKKIILTILALAAGAHMALASTVFLDVNFENGFGGATLIGTNEDRTITIIDSNTTPVDPFGGADNHSMLISHGTTKGGTAAMARWDLPWSLTEGTVSFDMYAFSGGEYSSPTAAAYLYSGSSIAAGVSFLSQNRIQVFGADGEGGANKTFTMSTQWTQNVASTVKIILNVDHTFSVYLEDILLADAAGQSAFFLRGGLSDVDRFALANSSSSSVGSQVAFDDILVVGIPESSTVGLLAGAFCFGIIFLRKLYRR